MVNRSIIDVRIVDIQKRKVPSKHYVYVISVKWSDSSVNTVYRRYSKFFDLQTKLIEEFPIEGGVHNPSSRLLPFLPGKIIFKRSHVRDVAEKRKEPISEYCAKLIALEPKISHCDLVLNFFEPKSEDIDIPTEKKKEKKKETADVISDPISLEQFVAIADYKKQNRNEVNMVAGDVVEVIDKNENGWWFVNIDEEQGWVPAAYLESVDGQTDEMMCTEVTSINDNQYIASQAHRAELDDEVSFEKGVILTVLKKNFDGWWLVSYQDKEGWAPAMYLKKPDPMQLKLAGMGGGLPKLEIPKPETPKPVMQQRTSSAAGATVKGKNGIPPRKASVKRSIEKPGVSLFNRSYEKAFEPVKEAQMVRPEAEYFALNEFRAIGIQSGLDFDKGESIKVLDKSPNGWWFGKIGEHEGWIPSSYIGKREKSKNDVNSSASKPKRPEPPNVQSKPDQFGFQSDLASAIGSVTLQKTRETSRNSYVAIAAFEDNSEGILSLREGDVVEVVDQSEGEWWLVKLNDREGWAPSNYLKQYDGPQETRPKPPKPKASAKPKPPQKPSVKPSPHKYDKPVFPALPVLKPVIKIIPKEDKKPVDPVPAKKIGKLNTSLFESKIPLAPPQNQTDKQHSSPSKSVVASKTCVATASYTSQEEGGVSFTQGECFQFVQDSGSGWWLVKTKEGEEKWAPASYLEMKESTTGNTTEKKRATRREPPPPPNAKPTGSKPAKPVAPKPAKRDHKPPRPVPPKKTAGPSKQMCIAVATFADEEEASVSFQEGDTLEVLEQNDSGWWYVKTERDECGWAPSNFLRPAS